MKKWFLILPVAVALMYFSGPKPANPIFPDRINPSTVTLQQMLAHIAEREKSEPGLKPDNEARIIWNDKTIGKTPYVMVYLHGWSASYMEGDPIHKELAHRFGANLYLPRLYGHGVELGDENFADLTAENLMQSAVTALSEALVLGDSVILVGTSTGGTLGLYLAGIEPRIAGLVLYSPNVRIYDSNAALLDKPWGVQMAKLVTGSDFHDWDAEGPRKQYWTSHYRLEGLSQLVSLVSHTMVPEIFQKVTPPTFVGYYYKNDSLQDNTVSVPAIREMFPQLITTKKRLIAFPEVGAHVMASSLTSKDLASVRRETIKFLEEVVGIKPVIHSALELEAAR